MLEAAPPPPPWLPLPCPPPPPPPHAAEKTTNKVSKAEPKSKNRQDVVFLKAHAPLSISLAISAPSTQSVVLLPNTADGREKTHRLGCKNVKSSLNTGELGRDVLSLAGGADTLTAMFCGERIKILVVGDDQSSLAALEGALSYEGFDTRSVEETGADLPVVDSSWRPEVILLYLRHDAMRAITVCQQIRDVSLEQAIITLADQGSEKDEIRGLDAGADDYLIGPFSLEVLMARIRANVRGRRDAAGKRQIIEVGDLQLDVRNYAARIKGKLVDLRPQEFRLLTILGQSPGQPLNSEELMRRMPGQWRGDPKRTVKIQICRLRAAIEIPSDYTYIHTIRMVGYRFRPVLKAQSSNSHRG